MGSSTGPGGKKARGIVAMGLKQGDVVQELGWDSDVDESLRDAIMDAIDAEMVDDPLEAVDAVLLWWRDDDGDLVDGLVDALRDLGEAGCVWLMTPKVGRAGSVDAADINEASATAGLSLANPVKVSDDWLAQKVVRPRSGRR